MKSRDIENIYYRLNNSVKKLYQYRSEINHVKNNTDKWIKGSAASSFNNKFKNILRGLDTNIESIERLRKKLLNVQGVLREKEKKG